MNRFAEPKPLILLSILVMMFAVHQPAHAAAAQCIQVTANPRTEYPTLPTLSYRTVINVNTGQATETRVAEGIEDVAYSPDKKQVVYWEQPPLPKNNEPILKFPDYYLYLMSVEKGERQLLTIVYPLLVTDLQAIKAYWQWSPDSRWLAFIGFETPDKPDSLYLGIVNPKGMKSSIDLSRLPQRPVQSFLGGWSADGEYLAFGVKYRENEDGELWVWKANSGELYKIGKASNAQTLWTLQGHQLLVYHASKLTLWSPERGVQSEVSVVLGYGWYDTLEWSPKGKHVLFRNEDPHAGSTAYYLIGVTSDSLIKQTDKVTINALLDEDNAQFLPDHQYSLVNWFDNGDALIDVAVDGKRQLRRMNLVTNRNDSFEPQPISSLNAEGGSALISYLRDGKVYLDKVDPTGRRQSLIQLPTATDKYWLWKTRDNYLLLYNNDRRATTILSLDGKHQWTIADYDFAWIAKDWLIYPEASGTGYRLHLLNLQADKDIVLGEISPNFPMHTPSLSPDRKKVAYRSDKNKLTIYWLETGQSHTIQTGNIWLFDERFARQDASPHWLYEQEMEWMQERLAWSLDSSTLAYWELPSEPEDADMSLYLVSPNESLTRNHLYTAHMSQADRGYFSTIWTQCPAK